MIGTEPNENGVVEFTVEEIREMFSLERVMDERPVLQAAVIEYAGDISISFHLRPDGIMTMLEFGHQHFPKMTQHETGEDDDPGDLLHEVYSYVRQRRGPEIKRIAGMVK